MTGNITMTNSSYITGLPTTPTNATDAASKAYVDALASGLDPKAAVKAASTVSGGNVDLASFAPGGALDGVVINEGDRFLLKNQTDNKENGIYVMGGALAARAGDADGTPVGEVVKGMYVYVTAGNTQEATGWVLTAGNPVVLGTTAMTFSQFSAAGLIVAGTGLSKTGNVLSIGMGAGIQELPSDEVGVDLYSSGGLWTTVDGTSGSSTSAAKLSIKLADTSLSLGASGLSVSTGGAIGTLQGELDDLEAAIGAMVDANGDYVAFTTSHYMNSATTVTGAVTALDGAIDGVQGELDDLETAVGAMVDGNGDYVAFSGSFYMDAATTVTGAVSALDTAIDGVQGELDDFESAAGAMIGNDGKYVAFTTSHYMNSATTVTGAMTALDGAIDGVQGEVDAIETSLGAMVDENGDYVAFTTSHYMNSATTVTGAVTALDGAVDGVQGELDDLETAIGGMVDGNGDYVAFTTSHYMNAATSVTGAVTALDGAINTVQGELDDLETALGGMVDGNGDYVAFTTSHYMNAATSVTGAVSALDGAVYTIQTNLTNAWYTTTTSTPATQHTITHSLGTQDISVDVWVADPDDSNKFKNDLVAVTISTNNAIVIDLSVARNVKVLVRKNVSFA